MHPYISSYLVQSHRRDLDTQASEQRLAREAKCAAREARQAAKTSTRRSLGVPAAIRLAGLSIF